MPRFSGRSARFVNRYRLGLPTSIFSRESCRLLAGDHLVLVAEQKIPACGYPLPDFTHLLACKEADSSSRVWLVSSL